MSARKITIEIEHDLQDVVYLKTDPEQLARMVTAISIKPTGAIMYGLSCGVNDSWHYSFEISVERDIMKATSN
jgi:hypothetical protein